MQQSVIQSIVDCIAQFLNTHQSGSRNNKLKPAESMRLRLVNHGITNNGMSTCSVSMPLCLTLRNQLIGVNHFCEPKKNLICLYTQSNLINVNLCYPSIVFCGTGVNVRTIYGMYTCITVSPQQALYNNMFRHPVLIVSLLTSFMTYLTALHASLEHDRHRVCDEKKITND